MKLRFAAVLIFVFMLPATCLGISLDEAVEYAKQHSQKVGIARQEVHKVEATGRQGRAFALPQVKMGARYLDLGSNSPRLPSPLDFFAPPESDVGASISASQVLFSGFKAHNAYQLEKALNAGAKLAFSSTVSTVERDVREAFDRVLLARANLAILEDRVSQNESQYQDAKSLKEAGMVTRLDERQSQQALNIATDALRDGKAQLVSAINNFNVTLGRFAAETPLIPQGDIADVPDMHSLIERLETMLESRTLLDIEKARADIRTSSLVYDISKGDYYPNLYLVAQGETAGEKPGSRDESWSLGVQLSWDIYDGGARKAARAKALAEMNQAREGLELALRELSGAIENIKVGFVALEERIAIANASVELARQNYEDAREQYREGFISITQLGDFNLYFSEARFNVTRLHYERRMLATAAILLLAQDS
ncbi:MAG: TolC family protein [Desulfatibacillaceae bacterium]|nr:TolC family protein [Desulfatibacillaceae bacterium]